MSLDELDIKLQEFLNSNDEEIKDIASEIRTLYEGIYRNSLSIEQFKELAEDLLEAQKVRQSSINLDRKIKILQAINAIRTIVGLIPK